MEKKRKILFIEKSFQAKFIIKFCAIVIVSSLIIGCSIFFLSRNFTTVAIEDVKVTVKRTSDFILPIMTVTLVLVAIFSALSVIILTLFASHKIAGPIYRLKKEIDALTGGNLNSNFKLRRKDQLQDLANSLHGTVNILKEKHRELKEKVSQLKDIVQNSHEDRNALNSKLYEVEEILNFFKI